LVCLVFVVELNMKNYPDLVAEFAEKQGIYFRPELRAEGIRVTKEILLAPETKALVQEVARLSAENATYKLVDFEIIPILNQDWWQEFTKEKE
jgi:uncharacterized protein YpmB